MAIVATTPAFFIPDVPSDQQEAKYSQLAQQFSCDPSEPGQRIYSITFINNGEEWTATVGASLSGFRKRPVKRKEGGTYDLKTPISDPATVLAIFNNAGSYVVITNKHSQSQWANPIYAGDSPLKVSPFTR